MTRRASRSLKSIEGHPAVPSSTESQVHPGAFVVALIWLTGFSWWFFSFGLPNNPGIQRWMLWSLIPFDLFDVIDPPLVAGAAPWSWLYLFQRVPLLMVPAIVWSGAWGLGSLVLRWSQVRLSGCERVFFATCLGLSLISLLTLLFGVCGLLNRWLMLSAVLAGPLVEVVYLIRSRPLEGILRHDSWLSGLSVPHLSRLGWVILIGVTPFVIVQMLGAMSPQTDFDVVEYHLGGPKEWFQQGRIVRLPHNVYTNFPFLSEMLILDGMVLYGDWQWGALAGQAIIAGFAPLTAIGLFAAGQRWFSTSSGWIAALIYLTSPWTYRISIIAYAEGSLACYTLAALYAFLLFHERLAGEVDSPGGRHQAVPFALLAGLMSGSAMACKYTGLTSVVVPIGLLLFWSTIRAVRVVRFRRIVLVGTLFLSGVIISVGPWLIKNAITTGNPVYPLAVRQFGGVDRDEELDAKWRRGHAARKYHDWSERLADLPVKLADVAANNDWHSPLMFGLAPLSLLWLRRRPVQPYESQKRVMQSIVIGSTWLYVGWQFSTWWLLTHHIDRFYVPMFSVVALLAGAGARWPFSPMERKYIPPHHQREGASAFAVPLSTYRVLTIWNWAAAATMLVSILFNAEVMLRLGGFNAGRLDLIAARDIATPFRMRWLNDEFESGRLPPTTKVLCVGEAQMFHARYPYLYNTVFDRSLFEQLCALTDSTGQHLRPIDDIRSDFRRLGVTHIDVNWAEIGRYRAPGSYGYSDFVQPEVFAALQREGLLGPSLLTTMTDGKTGTMTGQIFPVVD